MFLKLAFCFSLFFYTAKNFAFEYVERVAPPPRYVEPGQNHSEFIQPFEERAPEIDAIEIKKGSSNSIEVFIVFRLNKFCFDQQDIFIEKTATATMITPRFRLNNFTKPCVSSGSISRSIKVADLDSLQIQTKNIYILGSNGWHKRTWTP